MSSVQDCGGINSTRVSWSLTDALVSSNTAGGGQGGGLLLALGFACEMYDIPTATIALRVPDACVSIRNSRLEGNSAAGGGGALAIHNPYFVASPSVQHHTAPLRVLLHNATFTGNSAGRDVTVDVVEALTRAPQSGMGGALYLHVPPAWRNQSQGWWTENCVLSVSEGSSFQGNVASDMGGAAALVWCAAQLNGGTLLEGNSAGVSGGGLALLQDQADVSNQPETQLSAWEMDTFMVTATRWWGARGASLQGLCGPSSTEGERHCV